LNEWLRRYAGQNRRNDTAATWVIATPDGRVAAYASLAMTGIDRSAVPEGLGKGAPNPVPGLLIGRLAVDRAFGGQGVGTALVLHALAVALDLNASAACKAVVVVALSEEAKTWWMRLGFHCFDEDDDSCLALYLLTSEISKTLGRAD
jgi:GNAT superfamily N-acetyltransferase